MEEKRTPGKTGGAKQRRKLHSSGNNYIPDVWFAQALDIPIYQLRTAVNYGQLPIPCRSTSACDFWHLTTVVRIFRLVESGRIYIGRRDK